MARLPRLDIKTGINHSPHVVILGAGASKEAFPKGDTNGRIVPLVSELVEALDLMSLLRREGLQSFADNFELFYNRLLSQNPEKAKEVVFVHTEISDAAIKPFPPPITEP